MRIVVFLVVAWMGMTAGEVGLARTAQQEAPARSEAELLVESWIERWNALDGTPESVQALLELYEADALHTTSPASHQLGTVVYRGHDAIRKMATDFTEAFEKQACRIETVTANEVSAQLFHATEGPWGGPSVAVEYVCAYTARADGTRYVYPGAAFCQIRDGRIHRLRLYMADGELAEVEPDRR